MTHLIAGSRGRWSWSAVAVFFLLVSASSWGSMGFAQTEADVPPDAVPEVQQVKPSQASAGEELNVTVDGRNFSTGAYVSFTNPAVRVVSGHRVSPTQLEVRLAINKKAQPGAVTLYVSNPASSVAQTAFMIVAGNEPTATNPSPAVQPPNPAPSPGASKTEVQPAESKSPEVSEVDPPHAASGSQANLKIKGKNFAQGARIAFSNPGIRVLEVNVAKSTEITARIQVANDATGGATSLFVVNPGDQEVEVPFEVSGATTTATTPKTKGSTTPEKTSTSASSFEVYNLGEVVSILQGTSKQQKGTLAVLRGKLTYQEGGKDLFSAAAAEIKEIESNTILGVNTGTFHIILNSGKVYNFVAATLRAADTQSIIASLRRDLQ